MIELVGFGGALVLQGVGMFYRYRRKIAAANKAVADLEKTIAEKNVIIEQRDKTIAEKDKLLAEKEKLIAETELLGIDQHQKRVEVKMAQLELRQKLAGDLEKYQDAQHKLGDLFQQITKKIAAGSDASDARNRTVRHLTGDLLQSFSSYIDNATVCYRGEQPDVVAIFLHADVIPVLEELRAAVEALNAPEIVAHCAHSSQPLRLTQASLGSVLRCFAELLPHLLDTQRERLEREALTPIEGLGVPVLAFGGSPPKLPP